MSRLRIATSTGLAAVAVLAAGAPGGTSAEVEPTLRPALLVGPLSPLRVRGVRFQPKERIRITLDGGKRGAATVVATRTGAFTVAFQLRLAQCRTVTVRAVGSNGSRAVRQVPRPNCREP